ncbi:retinitis pigmentosa 1-like 1 protein [Melanotaenia boesemani]|uniref:retinitis pigmentosa 1-like 1 protein n=1 Tax=Melanotaenia boesemani TaxID=1250792 RepID=UPI001C044EF4|nr:retinitis pigmentosa 1-like 1 protein [Melanotaenia boesemani]
MHSVQTRLWDPRPPSKHVSPFPAPPPSNLRQAHVTSAPPAKRITFYKSGDSQFGGVRMAIHKRSFKCFDALLDDLSQKVPLPFGVRTVTTPRGTHTIKHLEQLQDGGCYLCSDRRHAKPINIELASKRQGLWYHHGRRPQRPEAPSTTPPGHMHLPYRQRRILLVKNSEPGMRRSIVLSRRSTRSLRAFLEEVSEVMQFHVHKLYTAEGRRIDSIQTLMTCPGVLVCVGREAFSPMLINFIRKTSEEKLPGLSNKSPSFGPRTPGNGSRSPATQGVRSSPHGAQSRASEHDEGHESKKNVNFGLETKKSIIHPRSDSSNRSARFSLSSEKSCGVFSQARPAIMNDDIEKRVLVNKDGSLSVEMRVRFHLQSDETLQWSTQIKKSPSLTNESLPLSQTQPDYLQHGQSESCSDPDSTGYECVDYNGRPLQCALEENHCPCCYQRQDHQFDLWENPAHSLKHPPVPPPHTSNHTMMRHTHSSSSSSSCNSRRVVRCRARLSQSPGGSGSEQSQLVQEEMCMTEQVERRVEVAEDGDTQVEVCKVSRCCSKTELVAMDTNLRPHSGRSVEGELMIGEDENRPFSTVSTSSHVLQSLKEDQDDEDDDLPPSASQCSHRDVPSPSSTPEAHLDEKPMSRISASSIHSTKLKEREGTGSKALSGAPSCHCGAATPHSAERVPSSASNISKSRIPKSEEEGTADVEDEEIKRAVSGLSGHTGLSANSQKSGTSSVCPHCGGCKRAASSNGRASKRSNNSNRASPHPTSPLCNKENSDDDNGHDDKASDISAVSTQSNKTNLTNHGRLSAMSNVLEGRAPSAMSRSSNLESTGIDEEEKPTSNEGQTSNKSHKSVCHGSSGVTVDQDEERSPSTLSAQSGKSKYTSEALVINPEEEAEGENAIERAASFLSDKSGASVKSNKSSCSKVASPLDKTTTEEDDSGNRASSSLSVKSNTSAKADSVLSDKSTKSNVPAKSGTSHRSACSHCAKATSPVSKIEERPKDDLTEREEEAGIEERAASAMSAKSDRSDKSSKSAKASQRSSSPTSEARADGEERATSQLSGRLSVKSAKSSKCNDNEKAASPSLQVAEDAEESERPESMMSAKSENEKRPASARSGKSASSAKSCHVNTELDGTVDRSPSATSGRSHISAKSQKSNPSAASPNHDNTDAPIIETNGEESSMSAKSKSSGRSGASCKMNSSRNPSRSNVVTIKTPEGADEEGNERAPSVASGNEAGENVNNAPKSKSPGSSHGQTLSPKRTPLLQTHSPKTPAGSPKSSKSPAQHLQPGSCAGETRGSSALSVHSTTSVKSDRAKCRCGAGSGEKEKEEENKEDGKSEGASSFLSSSSKRQRKESEGTEKPLSRASSGSVSLGLPEDQDTADSDSGKSSVSFYKNTEATQNAPKSPASSSVKNDMEITGSSASQRSNGSSQSHNPIPTIEMPRGGEDGGEEGLEQNTERATSAVSVKSGRSHKSCSKCSVKSAQMPESKERDASPGPIPSPSKTGSVKSVSATNGSKMDTVNNRASSAMSGSAEVRSKSPASASVKDAAKSCVSTNSDTENQDISRPASEVKDKQDFAQNKTASIYSQNPCCLRPESAASTQSKSKKALQESEGKQDLVKSEGLSPVKSKKSRSETSSSQRKETHVKSSSPCSLRSSKPDSKVEACSESTLSHSLSAADLLKETMAAARQNSQQSKASKTSDKPRSEKSDRSKRSRAVKEREGDMEVTPACLPNASPNEVVSDWLRSIPANTSLHALGNELNEELEEHKEKEMEDTRGDETKKEESSGDESADKDEKVGSGEEGEKEDDGKCDAAEEEKSSGPGFGDAVGIHLSKNWHCSAAVMKVLLSSSSGRCRSMPEVSPVYGRRLSTSARGLLDCLAQLQLIEPAAGSGSQEQKDRKQQYDEIMAILQSLWLTEPRDIEVKEAKDGGLEQVTPPRSSSGVGMSSGSGGSGKDNGHQGEDETPAKETELLQEEEVVAKVAEEDEGGTKTKDEENGTEPEETSKAEELMKSEEQNGIPQSPKTTENPSSSDKSSTNNSSKSATDNERETLEGSPSDTPPNAPRAPLSKRLSQDPDPVWVLNLLKKLEKQFMSHYIDAMAEFKVRWDLDDSIILDTMISELREEVSRRIQSSIQREMRKIQSRAGKGGKSPRPPQLANISRDSTMTERRRRMLKVMKNQSVKTADSHSDEETAGEFSDQRSDDEYCPCDACVRKKMATRPFKTNPLAAEAPVMMEFDLLKILQLKKSPSPAPVTVHQPQEVVDEEGRNLEVVREEEEEDETKEDIKADLVLEETIAEEDEEVEQDKDEGDTQEEAEEEEDSEEQEEGATTGEEAEQDETSEKGEEDEGECTCQCTREQDENEKDEREEAEETSSNTGDEGEMGGNETGEKEDETETGEEEEESDKETVKEVSSGEVEEESGEDGTAEIAANEESTLVEEVVQGNVSASAEDDDDEDDGTGEGELHEDEKGGESEEQEGEASEEERISCQSQKATPTICVTEGEEADAEDSDDSKRRSDTGVEDSGQEETGGTGDEEEKESGEGGEADEDTVEEFKPEEDSTNKKEGALLHQFTKTSVESQSGSMEEVDMDPSSNPVDAIEVPKMADGVSTGGGVGHKRSRSPARVKRRKPKEIDNELEDF